jgi:hypothetical protein
MSSSAVRRSTGLTSATKTGFSFVNVKVMRRALPSVVD